MVSSASTYSNMLLTTKYKRELCISKALFLKKKLSFEIQAIIFVTDGDV